MGSLLQRIFIPFKCSHEHCIKSFMIGICRAHRLPWACGAGTLQTSRATWMHTNWENETCNNNRAIGFSMKKNQSNRYYRISQLQKIIKSVLLKVSYWSGNTRHSLSRVVHGWDHHLISQKQEKRGFSHLPWAVPWTWLAWACRPTPPMKRLKNSCPHQIINNTPEVLKNKIRWIPWGKEQHLIRLKIYCGEVGHLKGMISFWEMTFLRYLVALWRGIALMAWAVSLVFLKWTLKLEPCARIVKSEIANQN